MKNALLIVGVGLVGFAVFTEWRKRNPGATAQQVFNGGVSRTSGGGANAMNSPVSAFAATPAAAPQNACGDCASGPALGMTPARDSAMPVKVSSPDAVGSSYLDFL